MKRNRRAATAIVRYRGYAAPAVAASIAVHGIAVIALLSMPHAVRDATSDRTVPVVLLFETPTQGAAEADPAPVIPEPVSTEPALEAVPPAQPEPEPPPPVAPQPSPEPQPAALATSPPREPAASEPPAAQNPALRPQRRPQPATKVPFANSSLGGHTEAPAASGQTVLSGPVLPPHPIRGLAENRDPAYPEAARRRGEQGRVMLRVAVSVEGGPVSITVAQSSGFPRLDGAAAAAVRAWRFEPASRDGRALAGIADVPIVFRLEN